MSEHLKHPTHAPQSQIRRPTAAPARMRRKDHVASLQQRAHESPKTQALSRLQAQAHPVQRLVDNSPITHNGTYDDDGNLKHDSSVGVPGWAHDEQAAGPDKMPLTHNGTYDADGNLEHDESVGVPDWAQKEYNTASKVELIASVKDGKIGSIYFLDGRIRTTHGSGPELDINKLGSGSERYNLDMGVARRIFDGANKSLYKKLFKAISKDKKTKKLPKQTREQLAAKEYDRSFKRWLSKQLVDTPNDKLPMWIVPVTRPDEAYDLSVPPPDNLSLFEVFKHVSNGRVLGWHPSRGIASKFETNKQVVSVLKAAIAHIDGVTDINQRNTLFYNFIANRLPDFAAQIRRPDEV